MESLRQIPSAPKEIDSKEFRYETIYRVRVRFFDDDSRVVEISTNNFSTTHQVSPDGILMKVNTTNDPDQKVFADHQGLVQKMLVGDSLDRLITDNDN